jgi:hypothetical protein
MTSCQTEAQYQRRRPRQNLRRLVAQADWPAAAQARRLPSRGVGRDRPPASGGAGGLRSPGATERAWYSLPSVAQASTSSRNLGASDGSAENSIHPEVDTGIRLRRLRRSVPRREADGRGGRAQHVHPSGSGARSQKLVSGVIPPAPGRADRSRRACGRQAAILQCGQIFSHVAEPPGGGARLRSPVSRR